MYNYIVIHKKLKFNDEEMVFDLLWQAGVLYRNSGGMRAAPTCLPSSRRKLKVAHALGCGDGERCTCQEANRRCLQCTISAHTPVPCVTHTPVPYVTHTPYCVHACHSPVPYVTHTPYCVHACQTPVPCVTHTHPIVCMHATHQYPLLHTHTLLCACMPLNI